MKKTLLVIAALCSCLSLRAQDPEPASSYSVTVDFTYATRYVFRGVQLADDTLMPSVEVSSGAFTAGIWSAQPLIDNVDNEVDFYAGFGIPLQGEWALDVGFCTYYYPELDTSGGADEVTWETYIGISGTVGGVSPAPLCLLRPDVESLYLRRFIGLQRSIGASWCFIGLQCSTWPG